MQKHLSFFGKDMDINLTERAMDQSEKMNFPLIIEIQIYFSCMLGKRLAFYSGQPLDGAWEVDSELFASMLGEAKQLTKYVYVRFNTVMTKACPVSDYVGPPPVTDFIIKNQKPYVPAWLDIDFKNGLWSGHYGWPASVKGYMNTKQIRAQAVLAENVIKEIKGSPITN